MEETKTKKATVKKAAAPVDNWEYKDRNYYLIGNKTPLTYTLPSKHSKRYPLVWFDPEQGYEREMRYATNMKSIFVDEQKGAATLKHIVLEEVYGSELHIHLGHGMAPLEVFIDLKDVLGL